MNSVEKPSQRRPLVADLNPNLMCRLCGGYYVDAAAIIECLHTFCKSCLVRYLETNKYCPVCDVRVHKSTPLQNIRLDPTLQDMVYKLVPGLYHKEMKSRREFYSTRPNAPPSSPEDRGDIPSELCPFYTPDEPVSLVLEYRSPEVASDPSSYNKDFQSKRFLRCPAAVKITHLEKLLRNKYGLDNRYNIDLMLEDSKLSPDLTLMDVAYAFGRKRKGQFLFTYRIYDTQCKKMRLSGDDNDMDTLPAPLSSPEQVQPEVRNEPEAVNHFVAKLASSEPPASTTSTTTSVTTSLPAPVVTTPSVTTPVSSAPVVLAPYNSTPINSAPVILTPYNYAPVNSAPFSEPPVNLVPLSSAPVNSVTVSSAPVSSAPVSSSLVSSAPVSSSLVSSAPVSSSPISSAPVISAPVSSAPVSSAPVISAHVSSVPISTAPVSTAPVSTAPVSTAPVCTAPVRSAPVSKTPVSSAPVSKAPVSSAPILTSLNTHSNMTITAVVSSESSPVTTVTTSVEAVTTAATAVAPATTRVKSTVTPSTLTITPVTTSTTSSKSTTSVPTVASSLVTTTAPSLTVSVQRLNPATVKAASNKAVPDKTTTVPQADKSNKLDSIISRLGGPLKHTKPESNPVTTLKKDSSFKKPQGKEVQLRISENGEMITNVVHADKTSSPVPKTAVPPPAKPPVKVNHSTKSSEPAPKQSAVTPVSPSAAASPRKPGSSPVGYKTLKSGPKSWNPTISRNSFLSAKLEQQHQQQQQQLQKAQDNPSKPTASEPVVKPPRFFKARNTPRYLGNPASGVKPMYQIASSPPPSVQKPSPKPPSKPSTVLKLDPKTLTPIMTSSATASPPPTTQAKDRPPFLSTTISGSHNHLPCSRSVTTTSTSVTENSSKMTSADLAMRNAPTPHPYMRFLSMCDPLNPFSPRLADPNRIPSSPPYASLLRAPFSPLLVNSYGLSQPPPVGMLYNQPLHRQVNHTGPLSPVPGLPSPLPPTSALLPLSPSSTPKNVIPPVQWGPVSPSSPAPPSKVPVSPQAVPSKKSSTEVLPKVAVADKQTKLNGEKPPVKDKSAKKVDEAPAKTAAQGDVKSTNVKEKRDEAKSSEQDNNNTVVIEKKPVKSTEAVVEQTQSLSHNISKLCNPTPPAKESPAPKVHNLSADQVATVKVKQS